MLDMEQDFNTESLFIKNIFIMKNLTEFRKTVETGVARTLYFKFLLENNREAILRYGLNKSK